MLSNPTRERRNEKRESRKGREEEEEEEEEKEKRKKKSERLCLRHWTDRQTDRRTDRQTDRQAEAGREGNQARGREARPLSAGLKLEREIIKNKKKIKKSTFIHSCSSLIGSAVLGWAGLGELGEALESGPESRQDKTGHERHAALCRASLLRREDFPARGGGGEGRGGGRGWVDGRTDRQTDR